MRTVVIVVRNLGARWLGAYGNEWVATPCLDALAADGVVYDQHFATDLQLPALPVETVRVASLKDAVLHGTADAMIVCDDLVPPWAVSDAVFESYREDVDESLTPWREDLPATLAADDWDRLHFTFAALVTQLDAAFGKQLSTLDSNSTRIVVTSDAGFPLGEHGIVGPGESHLHEERVHLPLIVREPGALRAGERIDTLTTPEDLNVILKGEPVTRDRIVSKAGGHTTVRTAAWTLLTDGGTATLFRRPGDAWEVNDVSREFAEVVEELQDTHGLAGGS